MPEIEEPRVDGQDLQPLREPGSDQLLSDETKARIAQAIEFWNSQHETRRRADPS